MQRNLPLVWTRHLHNKDDKVKKDFENSIRNSTVCLTRLRDICIEYLEEIDQEEITDEHFDKPGWETRQAKLIGEKKRIRQIIHIIQGVIGDR